ncbi:hypothetical protein N7534_011670 [Penicillium rubens]|nr:hypothetical protein N7534_011670 [Penicillium rubens]
MPPNRPSEDDNRKLYLVVYDRRKLYSAELNYPVYEKELLAIKEAIRSIYRLSIRYRKGSENVVADTISRRLDLVGTTRANISLERPVRVRYLTLITIVYSIPEEE